MASTEKIKPRDLVVGGRYLHRNGLFIRQIEAIEENTVHYHDQGSSWSCSNSVFVRACPTVATAEDEARVAEELRKLARSRDGIGLRDSRGVGKDEGCRLLAATGDVEFDKAGCAMTCVVRMEQYG